MSCPTIVIIGIVVVALLWWICSRSAIAKYERKERHYRKWQKRLEEREGDSTPPDDHE